MGPPKAGFLSPAGVVTVQIRTGAFSIGGGLCGGYNSRTDGRARDD